MYKVYTIYCIFHFYTITIICILILRLYLCEMVISILQMILKEVHDLNPIYFRFSKPFRYCMERHCKDVKQALGKLRRLTCRLQSCKNKEDKCLMNDCGEKSRYGQMIAFDCSFRHCNNVESENLKQCVFRNCFEKYRKKRRLNDATAQCMQSYCGAEKGMENRLMCIHRWCHRQK